MNSQIIKQARADRNEAESRILRHLGISWHDRSSSELPSLDPITQQAQIVESINFETGSLRDSFAKIFQDLVPQSATPDLFVSMENNHEFAFPFSVQIKVKGEGINSLDKAFPILADYFQAAAAPFPVREGMPWKEYIETTYSVDPDKLYKSVADDQIKKITALGDILDVDMFVVGTHRSKSIQLPVVEIEFPRNYTTVKIQDNFHGIYASVKAKFPINCIHFGHLIEPPRFVSELNHFSETFRTYGDLMVLLNEVRHQDLAHKPQPKAEMALAL